MHPDKGFDNAISILKEYFVDQEANFNEADTRAKIIDRILKDCLGWTEETISREEFVNVGYIDYKLVINGSARLVIEAKKVGEYFELPENYSGKAFKIGGALSTVKNLKEALEQVKSYCDEIGCKYAAVCNGYQMVIFSAITAGKSWRDGYCIVFNSFEDIKDNFNRFWNILAKENVEKGSLVQYIDVGKRELTFKKVMTELHNPDTSWARNRLYTFIRPISEFVFDEMIDEAKTNVLKQCYVFERSNALLGSELENYYVDKLPNFANKYKIKDIYEGINKAGVFQDEILKKYKTNSSSMIVLLGGIGSGKSTFLHRFFRLVLSEQENLIWFTVDFSKGPLKTNEVDPIVRTARGLN